MASITPVVDGFVLRKGLFQIEHYPPSPTYICNQVLYLLPFPNLFTRTPNTFSQPTPLFVVESICIRINLSQAKR